MKDIGLRIKELRAIKKLTQSEFCDLICIKQANLSHIENSGKKISVEILNKIISNFNINANWLMIGEGTMLKNEDQGQKTIVEQDLIIKKGLESSPELEKYKAENELLKSQIDELKKDKEELKRDKEQLFAIINKK